MRRVIFLFLLFFSCVSSFSQLGDVRGKRVIADSKFIGNKIDQLSASDPEYEIVIFPDLQNMSFVGAPPARNRAGREMFKWVQDSAAYYNVKAVIGVGDMTSDANTAAEWDTLNAWYGRLDAINMPYMTPPGNHDYNNRFTMFATGRDLTSYNTHFGAARYSSKPYFVSVFRPGKFENSLYYFTAGTRKYAVFSMEFFPTDSAMNWVGAKCDSIYAADPTVQVILTTHAYIRTDGYEYERSEDGDPSSVNAYPPGPGGVGYDHSGEEVWEKLGKKKPNIRFIFGGHFVKPGGGLFKGYVTRISSAGENANIVDQFLVNYQNASDFGNGYMMRLRFKPGSGTVTASLWSPYDTDCGGCGRFDPMYPAYAFDDPTIQIQSSTGVSKSLAVQQDLRVEGNVNFWKLNRGFVPYTSFDGRIMTNPNLRWTSGDSLQLLVGNPTWESNYRVQVSGGLKADRFKLTALTGMRIPFTSADGTLKDASLLRLSGDSSRLLIGDPTDDGYNRININGGLRVYGNIQSDDSLHVFADAITTGNPFWFRSGHIGNPATGPGTSTLLRVEFAGSPTEARWYNAARFRPPTTVFNGSFTSIEIGANTNVYSSTYLAHFYEGNLSTNNYFAIDNHHPSGIVSKFWADGLTQFGGAYATAKQPSALMELIATDKGFLPPRLSAAQRLAISSPATGLTVFDTDSLKLATYNGTVWRFPSYTSDVSQSAWGAYTPTIVGGTNYESSTPFEIIWERKGSTVHYSGSILINATATGAVSLEMSLPPGITSDFSITTDAPGVVTPATDVVTGGSGSIFAHVANNTLLLQANATTANDFIYAFSGSFKIL